MDLRGLAPMLAALRDRATGATAAVGAAGGAVAGAGIAQEAGASFRAALADALKSVSQVQEQAASTQQAYISGSAGASLEQTMIAVQKSQLAFQSAVTVRNRLVSAYSDIMNMNV